MTLIPKEEKRMKRRKKLNKYALGQKSNKHTHQTDTNIKDDTGNSRPIVTGGKPSALANIISSAMLINAMAGSAFSYLPTDEEEK